MSDSEKLQSERSFERSHERSPSPRGRKRSRSRSMSDDGDRRSKRRPHGDRLELRLLIRSKDAGSIIGRGGSNIKHLRQDFKAGVMISDSRTPERIVVMSGELKSIENVLDEILSKCLDERRDSGRRDSEVEGKLLIHQSQAGCVIGKAGNKLKEMRMEFGVDIKVYSQCCPRSTERVVQVIGKAHSVCRCIINILDMLKTWSPRGVNSPYDPANYDDFTVREYGGYDDDDRGRGGRGDRNRGGRRPSSSRDRSSSSGGGLSGVGGFALSSLLGGVGGGGGQRTTQQVSIPSEFAGVVIGKGGQNIRQIRIDSGADVELSDSAGSSDRVITITGYPDQIQNAQYLLQKSVKQHLARN